MSTDPSAAGSPEPPAVLAGAKGHGTRNDFVLIDDPDGRLDLAEETVAALADRRSGIGGDGVIRVVRAASADLEPAELVALAGTAPVPEWFMDYRNADGSIAEMCGNGARVFAAYLEASGLVAERSFDVLTRAGVKHVEVLESAAGDGRAEVRVGMGEGRTGDALDVRVGDRSWSARTVDMGNPHAVVLLDAGADPAGADLVGLDLTRAPRLEPEPETGSNVEFVAAVGPGHIRMRVFERGVGETESCGTGICAAAVAARADELARSGLARDDWRVDVRGGTLMVRIDPTDRTVTLQGEARLVGRLEVPVPGALGAP